MEFTSWSVNLRKGRGWQGVAKYKDENGKWKNKTKMFPDATGKRAAEAECEAWFDSLNEAEAAREARPAHDPSQTVAEYVAAYIDGCKVHAEPSTISGYSHTLRRQIGPHPIAGVPLDELRPADVRAWLAALTEDYGPTSVNKAFVLLRSAMRQAVNDERLPRNPTDGVKPPKRPSPKPNAIPREQLGTVTRALIEARQSPEVVGIRLALYTGMREGEICALRWRNVRLEERALDVREAIGRDGGRLYVKEPKTGGSRRTVYYPEEAAAMLRARRTEMMEQCMAAGIPLSPDMFVLGGIDKSEQTGDYRFLHTHTLWEQWRIMADLMGLVGTQGRPVTFHDLRHTFATAAIAGGSDVKAVSAALGHANAAMTLDTYADADPSAKRGLADKMGEALAPSRQEPAMVLPFRGTGTEG